MSRTVPLPCPVGPWPATPGFPVVRVTLSVDRAQGGRGVELNTSPNFLARTALAMAALAALSGLPQTASAVGLGRLNVQSALGEGMRADIDLSNLTAEEASSLQVRIASPEAYRAAGVDYNPVLASSRAIIVRRTDGRAQVRLISDRAVQEPFVEVILELGWANGRLVREFTLLFDPPGQRLPAPVAAPVAPVMGAAPPAPAPAPMPAVIPNTASASSAGNGGTGRGTVVNTRAPRAEAPVAAAPVPAPATERKVTRAAPERPARAPAAPAPAPAAPMREPADRLPVRPGDSLSRLAARNAPQGVSLDQMLVGLYRANPDAFLGQNINRLRAGAVLKVPTSESMRQVSSGEARQIIAQSADFGAYRQKLAREVPTAPAAEGARQSAGKVTAAVDDRKAAGQTSPDKLKLSPAAPAGKGAADNAPRKDEARVAELTRNLEELKQLQQTTAAAKAPAGTPVPPPAPVVPAPAPAPAPVVPPAPVMPPVAAASVPAAVAPVVVASAALPPAPAPVVPPMPASAPVMAPAPLPSVDGGGWLDSLGGNPFLLPGLGVAALGLAGFAAWRMRGRFNKTASETSFLESRMQPDSFFGASGGQRVDTADAQASNSSMGYSLSQLDAIGDVDPVAEADVYLAYGRDLQAEEILKEALRTTPDRLSVRTKLLEVYAKRRDTKGFEMLARQLYAMTRGQGPDWARTQELGLGIDPENPLYQPGGRPSDVLVEGDRVIEPLNAPTQPASNLSQTTQQLYGPGISGASAFAPSEVDLDLDLPTDAPTAPTPLAASTVTLGAADDPNALDFDLEPELTAGGHAPADFGPSGIPTDFQPHSLSMGLDDSRLPTPSRPGGDSTLDFPDFDPTDLGAATDIPTTTAGMLDGPSDPMARKLELAEEFRQIGDLEGARDLLEEVASRGTGELKARAVQMLGQLG
ncbi:MAG: hypothetical protein RL223_2387 [Pseudomonadota bacterium]